MGNEEFAGRAFINFALSYSIAWVISYYAALDWFDCWCPPKYSSPLRELMEELALVLPVLVGISGVAYIVGAKSLRSASGHQFNDDGIWGVGMLIFRNGSESPVTQSLCFSSVLCSPCLSKSSPPRLELLNGYQSQRRSQCGNFFKN